MKTTDRVMCYIHLFAWIWFGLVGYGIYIHHVDWQKRWSNASPGTDELKFAPTVEVAYDIYHIAGCGDEMGALPDLIDWYRSFELVSMRG